MKKFILFFLLFLYSSLSYSWQYYSTHKCEPQLSASFQSCLSAVISNPAVFKACRVEDHPLFIEHGYLCNNGDPFQQVQYSPTAPCVDPETWDQDSQSCVAPIECSAGDTIYFTYPFTGDLPQIHPGAPIEEGGCEYIFNTGLCSRGGSNAECVEQWTGTGNPMSSTASPMPDPTIGPPAPPPTAPDPGPVTGTQTDAPVVDIDSPGVGDVTTIEIETETTTNPTTTDITNESSETKIITVEGKTYKKTTIETTTTYADGSTSLTTEIEYTRNPSSTTKTKIEWANRSVTTDTTTDQGETGSSTTSSTTGSDGSTSTSSSSSGGGQEDEYPKIEEKGINQYDDLLDVSGIDGLVSGLGSDDPGIFEFGSPMSNMSSGCQSITTNFGNKTFTFPGSDGCQRLEQLKDILAFVLYVLTAYSIFEIAIRRPV